MSGPFNGPPLVAGSIHGFRHFNITKRGVLTSVIDSYRWHGGVNHATCAGGSYWITQILDGMDSPHKVAHPLCSCGFYAYYKPWRSAYVSPSRALGVIEGTGRVSVGPLGFRAEKAKVVAVCVPAGMGSIWETVMTLVMVVVCFIGAIVAIHPPLWPMALGPFFFAVAGRIASMFFLTKTPRKEYRQRLRDEYPDVFVYRSRVLMIIRYLPLTRKKVAM